MKRRRVLWSRDALDDLLQNAAYIARDNPAAARRIATALRKCGGQLGKSATGRRGRMSGTYEKVVPRLPYIIAYTLAPDRSGEDAVMILRLIHGARDWRAEAWPE